VSAGLGRHRPEDLARLLANKDSSMAPPMAPPSGLFLVEVKYVQNSLFVGHQKPTFTLDNSQAFSPSRSRSLRRRCGILRITSIPQRAREILRMIHLWLLEQSPCSLFGALVSMAFHDVFLEEASECLVNAGNTCIVNKLARLLILDS